MSELDEQITLCRNELQLHPQGDPNRAESLQDLADSLYDRFLEEGEMTDLEEALAFERSILELRPQGHPDRALALGNIATSLYSRFEQLGSLSDLEEALTLERSALELRPQGHPDRASSLSDIATFLYARFKQLGGLSDLEEALALERIIVIHLAAAMQFAGFRSVIGTMWAVDDAYTNGITSKFYDNMVDACGRLDHTRAALALHRTMSSIRPGDLPLDQRILYIHIGA